MTKLYIMNGPEKGKSYNLKGETTSIGRISVNDIQIKEKSISRKHIKILKRNGKSITLQEGSISVIPTPVKAAQ